MVYFLAIVSLLLLLSIQCCDSFIVVPTTTGSVQVQKRHFELFNRLNPTEITNDNSNDINNSNNDNFHSVSRHEVLNGIVQSVVTTASVFSVSLLLGVPDVSNAADSSDGVDVLETIKQARNQLAPVPDLIKNEKWDSVRAVLLKPPLADCWKKTSKKSSLLQLYAETIATDELEALEIKEELQGHLRFLDMAVYNNIFNPISSTGTLGATKELIRSYNEDPINEYKASIKFFDDLIKLSP